MDHATVETETTSQPLPLKTVLIGVATVAGAIGLFVRYYGCPGLLLGILMLLGGWSYLRGNRSATVTHLTLLLVFWITLQFFGPYTSLRNRVVWIVGTERLQQWAIEVLDNPPPPDEHGRRELDPQDIPEDIRILAGPMRQNNVIPKEDWCKDLPIFHRFGWGGIESPEFRSAIVAAYRYVGMEDTAKRYEEWEETRVEETVD